MDTKAYLKNVLKVDLGKELEGAFLPNREDMGVQQRCQCDSNDRLSTILIGSQLTNGTLS